MYLEIVGMQDDNWLFDWELLVDSKLDTRLYNQFKKNTFVFMPYWVFDKLNPSIQKNLSVADDEDLSVDEMMQKDILVILIDDSMDIYNDIVVPAQEILQEEMQYLIIEGIA